MKTTPKALHLAVLIDADNAPASVIEGILEETARLGTATVRRIYGDWTSPHLGGWKKVLLKHSIQPIQQFAYTSGKNATDSALIIDAMDLLHTHRFGGFCLVSSDSDFTRLAQRIREGGCVVYGFGERKTPQPFVAACDRFVYTDLLREEQEGASPARSAKGEGADDAAGTSLPDPVQLIRRAIGEADDDEDGWAPLATVGTFLNQIRPDFDPRLFGHSKLSDLVRAHDRHFELHSQAIPGSNAQRMAVRVKPGRKRR
ncbi:MAG: NYN domain-containing protein [Xanthomonadales bacterium]|nr:NYN domain-containing protein [Xanthomonadales bacterium]